jgi:cytochrome c-type biogenesis protein CcmH
MTRVVLVLVGMLWTACAFAIDTTELPDPVLQERYEALTHEFRCMQCQNNSIADSPVGLASDLRRDVKELLLAGKTDDEIRDYMVQRYGDVILFKPPFKSRTAWVWIAPMIVLVGGLFVGIRIVRRRTALVGTDETDVDSPIEGEERPQ